MDVEGLLQVGDEVFDVLDADGQADEVVRDLELRACDRGVGHPGRVLDERLDPTERLGERVQLHLRPPDTPEGTLIAEVDRDHAVRHGETVGVSVAAERWMPWYEEQA